MDTITGSNPVLTTKNKISMGKQFLKDLPIYLNGFAVGMLFWDIPKISVLNISMYVLATVTFFWYGKNK
jgi:hypothetical protein